MNIGIFLGHPAQYHFLKLVAKKLRENGHSVYYAVKEKDILENLLQNENEKYTKVRGKRGNSKIAMILSVLKMDKNIVKFVLHNKINLMMGVPPAFGSRILCNIPVLIMGEDDSYVAPRTAKILYPFASNLVTPISCYNGKAENKSIKYPGFQKLAYLHPNCFTPNADVVKKDNIDITKPYFLMRFVSLNAHHDSGVSGITTDVAQHLIDILSPYGEIYITSERPLEPQFEKYRLHINPLDIHHIMAFATLYLGDSQSMANEAAMLGTPSLRFNDFVGKKKIGVMEELEHSYGLTFGISSSEPEKLYSKIKELLAMTNLREEFQKRRQKMLSDKIDVTAFLTWFVENYPNSVKQAKGQKPDSEFWKQFK